MTADLYRAGLLELPGTCSLDYVQAMLPPEHRVVGFTPSDTDDVLAFLIEGPSMPEARRGAAPDLVRMMLTVSGIAGKPIRVEANWVHAPQMLWLVGEWPTFEAFRDNLVAKWWEPGGHGAPV